MSKKLVCLILLLAFTCFIQAQDIIEKIEKIPTELLSEEAKKMLKERGKLPVKEKEREVEEDIEKIYEKEVEEDIKRVDKEKEVEVKEEIKHFGYDFFLQAPTTFAPIPHTPVPPTYTLGPGDILSFTYWSKVGQETTHSLRVNYDGVVYVPMLGKITAAGLTFDNFQRILIKRLKAKFPQIEGYITLSKIRSIQVFVAGEATRPGGYTLSGLSTLFNALYFAGGPSRTGSMRKIKLIRNNKIVGEVDLYQYLLTGDKRHDYKLESGDTIFIPVIGPTVTIKGEVKRPAIYELKGNETIQDLIKMAGGLKSTGYTQRIQLERVKENKERIVIDINLTDKKDNNIKLKEGDIITVFEVLPLQKNMVWIEGQIAREGAYQYYPEMTIHDLIEKAEGLKPTDEVHMSRADIFRLTEDRQIEIVSFNLKKALQKDKQENKTLQEFDVVKIYSPDEAIFLDRTVRITGFVKNPGVYERTDNMKLSDLINIAGGLLPEASKEIELARANANSIEIKMINIDNLHNPNNDIILQDRDLVSVRKIAEFKRQPATITITGEVKYPGTYAIEEDKTTLYEILTRSGGLTADAYPKGAIFKRQEKNITTEDQLKVVNTIKETLEYLVEQEYRLQLAKYGQPLGTVKEKEPKVVIPPVGIDVSPPKTTKKKVDPAKVVPAAEKATELLKGGVERIEARPLGIIKPRELEKIEPTSLLAINLEKLIQTAGKEEDIILKDGDLLYIPKKPLTVTVAGAVINPGNIKYEEAKNINYYVDRCGGYTKDADSNKIVIIRANGEVVPKKEVKAVERGDIIIVPPKPIIVREIKDRWEKMKDIIKIIADTATAAYIIRSIGKR